MKREKITDMNKIAELFLEGKISRSTFWRARKRGYIILNYHSVQKISDNKLSKKDLLELYNIIRAKVVKFVTNNLRVLLEYCEMSMLIDDISHDIYVYILERQPTNIKQAVSMIKMGFYWIRQHPAWYNKYIDFPIRKHSARREVLKEDL